MRGLISNTIPEKFPKLRRVWAKVTSRAQSFSDLNEAIELAKEFGLTTGELILILGDQASDVTTALDLEDLLSQHRKDSNQPTL